MRESRATVFMVGLAVILALLFGVALVTPVKPAQAAFPGYNGKIAFQSYRDGNSEIYAMNPNGTNPTRLTTNAAWEGEPAVSPDGKRVAFVTDRDGGVNKEEIYVMDLQDANNDGNGDNPLRLTNDTTPDWAPAFSPDGTKIAYQEYGDGDSEVFVMNADGTGTPTRLTSNTLFDGNPGFSADGTKVYFVTDRDADPNQFTELYVMDAADTNNDGNGDNQTQLFGDLAIDYFAAAISPDDKKLAYQDYNDGDSEIYVKNLDGTGTPVRLTANTAWDGLSAFSPDGSKLVFGTDRHGGYGKEEIYVMNAADTNNDGNGDNQQRLTNDATSDYEPDWGPAPLLNDYFSSAKQIKGSKASVNGTTRLATREPGEPDHYTSNPADADWWEGDHSVWYRWKAPASGRTTINTCTANIDSVLAVYTGSQLNALNRVADDNNACSSGWGSKVSFRAKKGKIYRIAVADVGGARENTFTLKVRGARP